MELTNALRKTVGALDSARIRRQEGLFKAEGTKCVLETLPYFSVAYFFATDRWLSANGSEIKTICSKVTKVTLKDIARMSSMSCPPEVIAVYHIPHCDFSPDMLHGKLSLALDTIQDPGNLGTILRTADWMGVEHVVCSHSTVDVYNPKVVQSTMGGIARVRVHYADLSEVLSFASREMPVIGTFLDGENIYSAALPHEAVIVVGNEGRGISGDVSRCVNLRVSIPPFPPHRLTVESLNAAMATGIVLAEFRRRMM